MTAAGFERDLIVWHAINGVVILGVLYLGIISTALAMYLWNSALARLDAGIVSLLFFAQPVVGASLGVIFLGEALSHGFWVGAALISAGLLLAARERQI
jgi:drug/metabolite transporter (DMT)-like permease